jgi:hypothetical protein
MSTSRSASAHSVADPLPGLRKQLANEYGDAIPAETLDRVAEQSLGAFQGARVREFVPVFAWRLARQPLSQRP